MAKWYRPVDRDQLFVLPPDMREWLPEDHPVYLMIRAVDEHMDTSAFHAGRRLGGAGTAGYHPDMLLTVLVWAYAHGVTSSRRMEELCGTDIAFRVICGGNLPDHTTFARFRGQFAGAVQEFFGQVLVLCARLGMGRLGTVALDGTKVAANASKAANRTEEGLRKLAEEAVAAHAATDAAEDARYGAGRRGDEVPEGAWHPRRRDERIAAALASLDDEREARERAEQARAEGFRERQRAGQRTGCPPARAAAELAEEQLAREMAAQQAKIDDWEARNAASVAETGRRLGNPPKRPASEHCRVKQAAAKAEKARARAAAAERKAAAKDQARVRNLTDPDSRLMPVRGGGFLQGYNAQNMTSEDGLVIATELTGDTDDHKWFEPMLARGQDAAALIDAHRPPPGDRREHHGGGQDHDRGGIGQVLADTGYCSEDNLTCEGPDRLVATAKRRDLEKAARGQDAGRDQGGPATQAMRERLKTPEGIAAYRHRGHIAETPHGHIKHNMGIRQLSLRGKPRASAEWTFICAVHNLLKALSTGNLTSQALAALAG
jgi:transposase